METIVADVIARQERERVYPMTSSQSNSSSGLTPARKSEGCNPLSVFRTCHPATPEQIMPLMYRMAANFPAMNMTYTVGSERISFWTVLGEQIAQLGWGYERTKYAAEYMLRNCKYREFRVAEFLQIDKNVQTISQEEFAAIECSRMPHKPIVVTQVGDAYQMLYKDDADKIGVPYRRKYTTWEASQMSREERKAAGIKWFD